jgi:hypothetical protein
MPVNKEIMMNNSNEMKALDLVELEQIEGGIQWGCAATSVGIGTAIGALAGPEGALAGAVAGGIYAYFYCA